MRTFDHFSVRSFSVCVFVRGSVGSVRLVFGEVTKSFQKGEIMTLIHNVDEHVSVI